MRMTSGHGAPGTGTRAGHQGINTKVHNCCASVSTGDRRSGAALARLECRPGVLAQGFPTFCIGRPGLRCAKPYTHAHSWQRCLHMPRACQHRTTSSYTHKHQRARHLERWQTASAHPRVRRAVPGAHPMAGAHRHQASACFLQSQRPTGYTSHFDTRDTRKARLTVPSR